MKRRIGISFCVVALSLVLAGCGSVLPQINPKALVKDRLKALQQATDLGQYTTHMKYPVQIIEMISEGGDTDINSKVYAAADLAGKNADLLFHRAIGAVIGDPVIADTGSGYQAIQAWKNGIYNGYYTTYWEGTANPLLWMIDTTGKDYN